MYRDPRNLFLQEYEGEASGEKGCFALLKYVFLLPFVAAWVIADVVVGSQMVIAVTELFRPGDWMPVDSSSAELVQAYFGRIFTLLFLAVWLLIWNSPLISILVSRFGGTVRR